MKKSLIATAALIALAFGAASAQAETVNVVFVTPSISNLHVGDVTQKAVSQAVNFGYGDSLDVTASATNAVNASTVEVHGYQTSNDYNNVDVNPGVVNVSFGDVNQASTATVLNAGDINYGNITAGATNVVNSSGINVTVDQMPVVDYYGGKG